MKVTVLGTGYVGLVTGTCFAEVGHTVTCVDTDQQKISLLQQGEVPFYEPGLKEKVERNGAAGRLHFTTTYADAIPNADFVFLALPTPSNGDGSADLSCLHSAIETLCPLLEGHTLLVMKSTAPVGTTRRLNEWITPPPDATVDLVSNPEFLKQGNAVTDFMRPDRILIGTESPEAAERMRELYSPFSLNHDKFLVMDPESAEMSKYASNAMLATRISFMNELSRLCEATGADVTRVRLGMGSDARIGYSFLYAGIGYGGSCFPKDVSALQASAEAQGLEMKLLAAVSSINDEQKRLLAHKICSYFGELEGKTLALLGLSFKPDTDDMRGAPSLTLIHELLEKGATLRLFDPVAIEKAKALLPDHPSLVWCESEEEAAIGSDGLVLVTEWKQFRFLDFDKLRPLMRGSVLFDGRNQYQPDEVAARGFTYIGIGRSPSKQREPCATAAGIH